MKIKKQFSTISTLIGAFLLLANIAFAELPRLEFIDRQKGTARLFVGGKPFVILGGELLNSSGSTASDMANKWENLKALNLNTVILAVPWEQIEKEEGKFDFSELKSIIKQAKENKMKLVLLWFGSWKNGNSGYAPYWVMADPDRFPRMEDKDGKFIPYLSNLSKEVLKHDKRAFLALMNFIKMEDSKGEVVVMVQIENEIGLLGDSRDRSKNADKVFSENVPSELVKSLKEKKDRLLPEIASAWEKNGRREVGSWQELFGQKNFLADEMFMAWHYAKFVNALASEGKKIHNIPMYVNAWTIGMDNPPAGVYPSGGPNYRMLDVWQAGASDVDILAIDNYQKEYSKKIKQFFNRGNPIFIPEACALWEGDNLSAGAKAFYTIGEFGAIGFSPFAIDHKTYSKAHPLAKAYEVLNNLMPEISKARAGENMRGFMKENQDVDAFDIGDIKVRVHYNFKSYKGFGLVVRLNENEFLVAATGVDVHFESLNPDKKGLVFGLTQEGYYKNGKWITTRYLGGDEAHGGVAGLHLPPVYLKGDADESQISVVKINLYQVKERP